MLKRLISGVFGTRHERERKRIQPIVDDINEHYERLHGVSEEELRSQTAKFRAEIAERTGELETRVNDLKAQKRAAADPAERDRLDTELIGNDGRGGAEASFAKRSRTRCTSSCQKRSPRCARHAVAWSGRR